MLEILSGRFGGEAGAREAGVGVEPVRHFGLVFCGGVFVAEYVGDLAFFCSGTGMGWVSGGVVGGHLGCGRSSRKVCACQRRYWGSGRGVLLERKERKKERKTKS